jgi:hypothetical protein
VGED